MNKETLNDWMKQLKEPFPESQIKERQGAGNKVFKYVPIDLVIQRLDEVFPLSWSWEVLDSRIVDTEIEKRVDWDKSESTWKPIMGMVPVKQVSVLGRLTLQLAADVTVSRDSWGGADLGKGGQAGDDFKIADSNALSKAAYRFGIGAHIGLEAQAEEAENPKPPFTTNKKSFNQPKNKNQGSSGEQSKSTNRNPLR